MRPPSRRHALKALGCSAVAGVLPPLRWTKVGGRNAEELAARLSAASIEEAFDVAVAAIRRGATIPDLLGAAYRCGVTDISPRPVGNHLHAVLAVESSFLLADAAEREDAWRFLFFNLHEVKKGQDADRRSGDWKLSPAPTDLWPDPATARRELRAAMQDWDVSRADRAVTSSVRAGDLGGALDVLRPFVARSSVDLGHKAVMGAHTERVLARVDGEHAEAAMRTCVRSLLHTRGSARFDHAYRAALGRARSIPDNWREGREAPDQSFALMRELRDQDLGDAQDTVVAAFQQGLGEATVWDGVRLFAHDVFLRRAGASSSEAIGPVHAVTATSSLSFIARRSSDDRIRRQIVLAAVGWIADLREELVRRALLRRRAPGLIALQDAEVEAVSIEQLLEDDHPSPQRARAALGEEPSRAEAFAVAVRRSLARKAVEVHQLKYAAALFEDASLVHPRWRGDLLAAAMPYLPTGREPDTELAERTERALVAAGIKEA